MDIPTTQQGNHILGATASGHQILGNNFSAGGNNVFNINNGPSTESLERKKCLRSLFVSNPADDRAKYISFKGQVIRSTFTWITKNEVYRSWVDQSTGSELIWLSGGPGMGKTMLSIFLTEELEKIQTEKGIILYYFCEGRDPKRNSAVNILRGLIYSLIQQRPALMKYLLPDFEVQEEALFGPEGIEPLWRIFLRMIKDPETGAVYCVIDGLDECAQTSIEQLEHILKKLRSFFVTNSNIDRVSKALGNLAMSQSEQNHSGTRSPRNPQEPNFKLALVSREDPQCLARELSAFQRLQLGKPQSQAQPIVQNATNSDGTSLPSSVMLQKPDQNDRLPSSVTPQTSCSPAEDADVNECMEPLHIYIKARIDELVKTKGYSEQVQQSLRESLQQSGDGTFLWVDMAIEQLTKAAIDDSQLALKGLPNGIEGMYCLTLLQIPPNVAIIAAFILRWVTATFRPLKIGEISAVLYFLNGQDKGPISDIIQPAIDSCRVLLDVSEDHEVKLGHQTIKDFLTRNSSPLLADPRLHQFFVNQENAHGEIAQTSVSYLESSCFSKGWFHVVSAGVDPATNNKIEPDPGTMEDFPFLQYSTIYWPEHMKQAPPGAINLTSPFFSPGNQLRLNWFKSAWGACKLRDGQNSPSWQSLLHIAAFFDLKELAESLARRPDFKTRLEKRNGELETPLFVAAARGSSKVFSFLLDSGAKQSMFSETILEYACRKGQLGSVKILVERGVNVNTIVNENIAYKSARALFRYAPKSLISYSVKTGDKEDAGILELTTQDYGGNTSALHGATISGQGEVVKFLLEQGADVHAATSKGWTTTHFAAWSGEPTLIELIVRHGGDLRAVTQDQWTLLHCAAKRGKVPAGDYLLEQGLQVDAFSDQLQTPLHLASWQGHEDMVRLLLSRGANSGAKTNKGLTALHLAAADGHDSVIRALLEYGANRDVASNGGETALMLAKGGRSSTTGTLLSTFRPPLRSQQSAPASLPDPSSNSIFPKPGLASFPRLPSLSVPLQAGPSQPPSTSYQTQYPQSPLLAQGLVNSTHNLQSELQQPSGQPVINTTALSSPPSVIADAPTYSQYTSNVGTPAPSTFDSNSGNIANPYTSSPPMQVNVPNFPMAQQPLPVSNVSMSPSPMSPLTPWSSNPVNFTQAHPAPVYTSQPSSNPPQQIYPPQVTMYNNPPQHNQPNHTYNQYNPSQDQYIAQYSHVQIAPIQNPQPLQNSGLYTTQSSMSSPHPSQHSPYYTQPSQSPAHYTTASQEEQQYGYPQQPTQNQYAMQQQMQMSQYPTQAQAYMSSPAPPQHGGLSQSQQPYWAAPPPPTFQPPPTTPIAGPKKSGLLRGLVSQFK